MTVTALQRLSKTKTRVTIDETDPLVLSPSDVTRYDLREGEEIQEDTWNELWKELRSRALRKSGMLLQDMDYSVKGLSDKLKKAGFPEQIIDAVVEDLIDAGYLDDRRFAAAYLRSHIESRSLLRVKMDLRSKGISDEILEGTLNSFEEEEENAASKEEKQILRLLEKKHYDPDLPYEERQKILASISRKGYMPDAIYGAVERLKNGAKED